MFSQKQVPSPIDKAKYAIEATIQAQAEIAPFGIGFITSAPLVEGRWRFVGPTTVMNGVRTGTLDGIPAARGSWSLIVGSPGIAPQRPVVITLISNVPFSILQMVKVNTQ